MLGTMTEPRLPELDRSLLRKALADAGFSPDFQRFRASFIGCLLYTSDAADE